MTLALVLSVCMCCASLGWQADSPAQNAAAAPQTSSTPAPTPDKPPPSTSQTTNPTTTQNKTAAAKTRRRKKKPAAANCDSNSGKTAGQPSPSSGPATGASKPTNCPPAKVIVRDGGTSEPAVQLTGGAGGGPASPQNVSTDQLLGATEENLKKLAGQQLTADQRGMVNQIHQYMEQSKAASAEGDGERGHSLAMKANLLSKELTKP